MGKSVAHILTEEYMRSCAGIKTSKEIQVEKGVSKSAVTRYCREYGVKLAMGHTSGDSHYRWKGGKYEKKGRGYMVKIDDPNYKYQYRPEHCVIMEEHLGRKLYKDEVVHHIDGDPFNNDLENLVNLTKSEHDRFHLLLGVLCIDHRQMSKEQVLNLVKVETMATIRSLVKGLISS